MQKRRDRKQTLTWCRETKEIDMEQSKFLGGDMEHTHLVKGLDYALLRKVRAEIEAEEKEKYDSALRAYHTLLTIV